MKTWTGDWTWRLGANSRLGMTYRTDQPADVRLCTHRHRSIESAMRCGVEMARKLNDAH